MKQLHDLTLNRSSSKEAFGFRIIGGKDEGQTFKVSIKYWLNYGHISSNKGTSVLRLILYWCKGKDNTLPNDG